MLVKIEVGDLKVGMYLTEIIKPIGKFNLLESGLIKSNKTISSLKTKEVKFASIDTERS